VKRYQVGAFHVLEGNRYPVDAFLSGLSLQLSEAERLPKSGPQLACPGRDHGVPSRLNKIPSLHAILIPATVATVQTSAPMSNVDLKTLLIVFIFMPFLPLVVAWLGKSKVRDFTR
jgi:hypothetical protein